MNLSINFQSVVAIGSFNPSILSPKFLAENKIFMPVEAPVGRRTPVITEVKIGNVQFLMELEKFQIVETEISNFENVHLLDILIKYLDILKYTPLIAAGLNFNYIITDIDLNKLCTGLKTGAKIKSNLGLDINEITVESKIIGGKFKCKALSTISSFKNGIKNAARIEFSDDRLLINNNFEISGLQNDRNRISILRQNYKGIIKENDKLIRKMK